LQPLKVANKVGDGSLKGTKRGADTEVASGMIILPEYVIFFIVAALAAFVFGFWAGRQILNQTNLGEALVANAINSGFARPHVLLNNVTIETEAGTAQIDHVLVADTGIFVIETKHYSGWIFGDPDASQWTQVIYKKKTKFPNPIRQNHGHVKALQGLFTLPEVNFIPLVVFSGSAEFKTDLGPAVVKIDGLLHAVMAKRPVIFDERKITYIVGRIEMKRLRRSIETDEYHLNSVRRRIQARAIAKGGRARSRVNVAVN
jgi:hypothetical protein